jgi:hypothetical protein
MTVSRGRYTCDMPPPRNFEFVFADSRREFHEKLLYAGA